MSIRLRLCMAKGRRESLRPSYGQPKLTLISREKNLIQCWNKRILKICLFIVMRNVQCGLHLNWQTDRLSHCHHIYLHRHLFHHEKYLVISIERCKNIDGVCKQNWNVKCYHNNLLEDSCRKHLTKKNAKVYILH